MKRSPTLPLQRRGGSKRGARQVPGATDTRPTDLTASYLPPKPRGALAPSCLRGRLSRPLPDVDPIRSPILTLRVEFESRDARDDLVPLRRVGPYLEPSFDRRQRADQFVYELLNHARMRRLTLSADIMDGKHVVDANMKVHERADPPVLGPRVEPLQHEQFAAL